jgi:hypothetical protein
VRQYDVVNESVLRAMHRVGPASEWFGASSLFPAFDFIANQPFVNDDAMQ